MISTRLARVALAGFFAAALGGCFPAGSSQPDEEKEPHFQRGRERVNSMDYGGAIEVFEKALEVNPHSGAAHFELGWLYADKQPEPASAIYHYEQYLKLRPRAANADTIRQHIFRQKQDLAKVVLPLPSTPGVQRQLEQLMEENKELQQEVGRWRAYFADRSVSAPTNAATALVNHARPSASGGAPLVSPNPGPAQIPAATNRPTGSATASSVNPAAKAHRVQSGETPSSVARKYNVKLDALLAANPDLNPRRMQVGKVLKIPTS